MGLQKATTEPLPESVSAPTEVKGSVGLAWCRIALLALVMVMVISPGMGDFMGWGKTAVLHLQSPKAMDVTVVTTDMGLWSDNNLGVVADRFGCAVIPMSWTGLQVVFCITAALSGLGLLGRLVTIGMPCRGNFSTITLLILDVLGFTAIAIFVIIFATMWNTNDICSKSYDDIFVIYDPIRASDLYSLGWAIYVYSMAVAPYFAVFAIDVVIANRTKAALAKAKQCGENTSLSQRL